MRRSTYNVSHADGREETLDRDALVARIDAGDLTGSELVSIAGGRPRPLREHPAFRRLFPDAPSTERPADPSRPAPPPSRPSRPTAPPVAPASRPSAADFTRGKTPVDVPVTLNSRGTVDPKSLIKEPVGSPELPVSSADATPLPESVLSRDPVEIRDLLWNATPEQAVGCRVQAGRGVALRSAGLRLRQLKARSSEATEATDRIRLEEAVRVVDAAMRIVTQPSKWRGWQSSCATSMGETSVGKYAKIPRGDVRATGGRRSAISPATATKERGSKKRVVAEGPDVLGKEMLAAAGVAGFATRELMDSDEHMAAVDAAQRATRKPGAGAARDADSRVPEWLRAPAHVREDGSPTEGPLVFGVGSRAAGLRTLGIVAAAALLGGALIAFGAPGGPEELAPTGVPLASLIRMLLAVLVAAAVFQSVRKEDPKRIGVPVAPQDALIACSVAIPGMLLFALGSPLPATESPAALLPLVLLMRAIAEWAMFDVAVTRTLLVEWERPAEAIGVSALLSGLYVATFAGQWGDGASWLAVPVWIGAVGLPAAWSVYRAGSALPALLVRVVAIVGGAIVAAALA